LHQSVSTLPVSLNIGDRFPEHLRAGRLLDERHRFGAGNLEYLAIPKDVRDAKGR
jgi:hypothetical protein